MAEYDEYDHSYSVDDDSPNNTASAEEVRLNTERSQWLRRARECYDNSTDYLDSSIRRNWETNLHHFRNEHAPGSKYSSPGYRGRSKVFRPKTRSTLRNLESAVAVAMFSNNDVVDIQAVNQADPAQLASARVNKHLLQYRLEKTIPWFETVLGAYQDCQNYGICISRQHWEYEESIEQSLQYAQDGAVEIIQSAETVLDQPAVDLIPPENFRFDPNADWRNVVAKSPYLIELVPMYAGDVLEKMGKIDPKTNAPEWHQYDLPEILSSRDTDSRNDTTRKAREGDNRQDPVDAETGNERTTVWAHFNIVRKNGKDVCFWTLGTQLLLSDPVPLADVYPSGRPYALGKTVLEAHRNYPAGVAELAAPLQEEINDVTNQRLDNVRLVLNKRYHVRRGGQVDLEALKKNVPGGGVFMSDPVKDVAVINTPDVTSSSYAEQDRLTVELDELLGTFSQASVQSNRSLNETVGGMSMMQSGANRVQEYGIRLFIESWIEPVLRQLVKLEQLYETDTVLLALAAQEAEIYLRFGIESVTDDLLMQELTTRVNVGMNNTNPVQKIERMNIGLGSVGNLPGAAQRLKEDEVIKEVFGALGFGDGKRFFKTPDEMQQEQQGENPEVALKQQELQLKQMELEIKQQQLQMQQQQFELRASTDREIAMMRLAAEKDWKLSELQAKIGIEGQKLQTERDRVALVETMRMNEMDLKREMGSGI